MNNILFVIPARKNSKGFPHKNRKLLPYTINLLKKIGINNVIITTDDEKIQKICKKEKIKLINRKKSISKDKTSIKDVMIDVIKNQKLKNKDICLLYLTYPFRNSEDVKKIIKTYYKKKCNTLLCLQPLATHPYLTMKKNKNKWEQAIKHNLYRRQDYPKCKEITHYLCIFNSNIIKNLNKNLYCDSTYWYELKSRVKDIDFIKDL